MSIGTVRVNAIAPIARTRLTLATAGVGDLMAEPDPGTSTTSPPGCRTDLSQLTAAKSPYSAGPCAG
jgi:hypothetical protein